MLSKNGDDEDDINWSNSFMIILQPKGDTEVNEKAEDNIWMNLNFTVDSETGEWHSFFFFYGIVKYLQFFFTQLCDNDKTVSIYL